MSKQSENREKQGFQKKCPCCGNCLHFTSEIVKEPCIVPGSYWEREKNLRCGIGGFKIGKSNWCQEHKFGENNAKN